MFLVSYILLGHRKCQVANDIQFHGINTDSCNSTNNIIVTVRFLSCLSFPTYVTTLLKKRCYSNTFWGAPANV